MPGGTTGRILSLLRTEVFSRYGYPRCLLSDNGSQFTSRQWQLALSEWGIEHWTTPTYQPQANPTERRNRDLKQILRVHLLDKQHRTWDQHLPKSLFALRQRGNRITGYSPAELFFGRRLCRPGDWQMGPAPEGSHADADIWYEAHKKEVDAKRVRARERMLKQAGALDIQEENAFKPGELVLRRNHALSNKAEGYHAGLAQKWVGPFEVDQRLGQGVYVLKTIPPVKVHASDLKRVEQSLRFNQRAEVEGDTTSAEVRGPRYNLRLRPGSVTPG